MVAERLDPDTALASAATRSAIIEVVRRYEHEAITERLDYLIELEAEEPDEEPMVIDSLRAVAAFVLSERDLHDPDIGVGPDGMIGLSWRLSPDGIVALDFSSPGLVHYAAIGPTPKDGGKRVRTAGTASPDDAMETLSPFLPQALER